MFRRSPHHYAARRDGIATVGSTLPFLSSSRNGNRTRIGRKGRAPLMNQPRCRLFAVMAIVVVLVTAVVMIGRPVREEGGSRVTETERRDVSLKKAVGEKRYNNLKKNVGKVSDSRVDDETKLKSGRDSFVEPPAIDEHGARYHVVFSTDCSSYQDWQSYSLFYHAWKVGQPGNITRIASGCTDEEISREKEWHATHISNAMSKRFHIHFTPKYVDLTVSSTDEAKQEKRPYEFFNKPFGLRHWMEHGEGMGIDPSTGKPLDEDVIVVLLDPDMVLLRPITVDFSSNHIDDSTSSIYEKRPLLVERGKPFAQRYGYYGQWTKYTDAAGPTSPSKRVSTDEGGTFYAVGPPYVVVASDMYKIACTWSDIVPGVHALYPYLLAEMFGYSIAAAHHQLPHVVFLDLMVSNYEDSTHESWEFMEGVTSNKMCELGLRLGSSPSPSSSLLIDGVSSASEAAAAVVPNTIHYCHRYVLGEWVFAKKRLPRNIFSCESPLLAIPPEDLAILYDYKIPPAAKENDPPSKPFKYEKPEHVDRQAYMICALSTAINEAADFFKRTHCDGVVGTSYAKTLELWKVYDEYYLAGDKRKK